MTTVIATSLHLLENLAQVEIQLIYQYLDLKSLLAAAICNKSLYNDANSKVTFKYQPMLNINNMNSYSTLLQNHTQIYFDSTCKDFNKKITEYPCINKYISNLKLFAFTINGCTDIQQISDFFANNQVLKSLSLSSVRIDDTGYLTLIDAIKLNSTLTSLCFRNTTIGNIGCIAIAELVMNNSTLTALDLCNNSIEDTGCIALLEAIKINTALLNLNFSYYDINGDIKNQNIANVIRFNNTLTFINIENNCIRSNGCTVIAEAIKVNCSLTFLKMGFNLIEDSGCVAISEAIKINSTLIYLDLSCNSIATIGSLAILDAIKINKTLTFINLIYNNLSKTDTVAIAEGIKTNPIIQLQIHV